MFPKRGLLGSRWRPFGARHGARVLKAPMSTEPDVAGRLRPAAGAFPPHKPHEGWAGAQRCPCPQPAERGWGGKAPRTAWPSPPPRARLPAPTHPCAAVPPVVAPERHTRQEVPERPCSRRTSVSPAGSHLLGRPHGTQHGAKPLRDPANEQTSEHTRCRARPVLAPSSLCRGRFRTAPAVMTDLWL